MKNDLSCDVVRDLLPSYIDELTSDDSNQAVQEHMSRCKECRDIYIAMSEAAEKDKERECRELDYLKGVKKKNRKKLRTAVAITAAALLLVFAIGIFSYNFLIGSPAYSWSHMPDVSVTEDNFLHLEFNNPNSALSYAHWSEHYTSYGSPDSESGGEIDIRVRELLSSPFYPSGSATREISLDNINKVSFMGRSLWENGLIISKRAQQLQLRAVTYVGAAPETRSLIDGFKMPEIPFTIEIHSDSEPYGLEIIFESAPDAAQNELMEKNAVLALALVNNLGQFSWSYNDASCNKIIENISLEQASEFLSELFFEYNEKNSAEWLMLSELKLYADSVYGIQQLLNVMAY